MKKYLIIAITVLMAVLVSCDKINVEPETPHILISGVKSVFIMAHPFDYECEKFIQMIPYEGNLHSEWKNDSVVCVNFFCVGGVRYHSHIKVGELRDIQQQLIGTSPLQPYDGFVRVTYDYTHSDLLTCPCR